MRFYRQSELRQLPRPRFLIDDLIMEHSLCQLGGPSGVGKTFVYTDWACQLAAGGRRVLVVLGEGLYRYETRLHAWQKYHGVIVPNDNLIIMPDVPSLPSAGQMREVITAVKQLGALDLIVVDTFAKSMVGYDEQSNADIAVALNNLSELRRATNDATGMLITHFGWSAERQRGGSSLYGECDTVVYVKRVTRKAVDEDDEENEPDSLGYINEGDPPKSRRIRLILDKQRDAPDDIPAKVLERTDVDLGYEDEAGRPVVSCVYLPVTPEPRRPKKTKVKAEANGHGNVIDLAERDHRRP